MTATPAPHASLPFSKALPWLLLITAVFSLNFVTRIIFSPLMIAIEADLGLTHIQAGRLFLDISMGYSLTLLFSGIVSSRLTHRTTLVVSAITSGCMLLLLPLSNSLLVTEILLFAFGMGCGLYLGSGIAALTSLVTPKDYGKAIAVHELAPNISFIVAPLLAEALLAFTSWRGVMAGLGGLSIAIGVAYARVGKGGDFKGEMPDFGLVGSIARRREFWVLILFFFLGLAVSFGPYSVLPLFLTAEKGMSAGAANTLLAISRLSGPITVFGAGWMSDKLGPRLTLGLYLCLSAITTALLGLTSGTALLVVAVVQPLISVCFFPAGFALISEVFPAHVRNVAVSLIVPLALLAGNGLVPTTLGYFGQTSSFAHGFVVLGIAVALGLAAMPALRRR